VNSTLDAQYSPRQQLGLHTAMPDALHEAFTSLIQRVYVSSQNSSVRILMVTAAQPGSGVSYIASCLSTLLAEKFGSTLLIQGRVLDDLARRRVRPVRSDCASVKQSRLSVLGETEAAEIVDHLGRGKKDVPFVIDWLLHEFEYVIVDAPALSMSKIALTLSPHVDGVLLVVVPNETDIGDVRGARNRLKSADAHLLGAIYNTILDHSGTN